MRNAFKTDIDRILEIYEQAKIWMRDHDVQQWDYHYPGIESIRKDMKKNEIFVFETKNIIYGVASLSFDKEEPYENPVKGRWKGVEPYGTIHRIAVMGNYRGTGISYDMMAEIKQYFKNQGIYRILVDTHRDNRWMIKYLENNGFFHRTEILTDRNHPRIGYEFINGNKK